VVAHYPERLMQWPLPALGTAGRAAGDLQVAAAGCDRRPAFAGPPVEEHRAWLPGMTPAAVLREAREGRTSWLLHELYSNIPSSNPEDQMCCRISFPASGELIARAPGGGARSARS
jgi:hypothetical protein